MPKSTIADEQTLSFDFSVRESKPSVEPRWDFKYLPDVDFIADEALCVISFDIAELEKAATSGSYSEPAIKSLLAAFNGLRASSVKSLRNESFTVFGGDAINFDLFLLGIASKKAQVVDFVASYLRQTPGKRFVESGSSTSLMPLFRYDGGYVIEYLEEGLEGTTLIDGPDNYGSGLTFYRRSWQPADSIEARRSVYGKLVK